MVLNIVSIQECEFFILSDSVNFSKGNLPHGAKYIEANDCLSGWVIFFNIS